MKKIILLGITFLILLAGCAKDETLTFEAQIDAIDSNSILVTTSDSREFDTASVNVRDIDIDFDLRVGQKVKIIILPEIKESYPVQVTAVKIEEVPIAEYQKLTVDEAKTMIDTGEYDIILDVRSLDEYNEGHIESAILLSYNEIKQKAEATLYDKDEVILVYCRSGKRSESAAKQLIDMGYTNVYDFGGIIDWPYDVVKE